MLPEIFEDLCLRDDVVAVRFPGRHRTAYNLRDLESEQFVQAILRMPEMKQARHLVVDIRNFDMISKRFLAICIRIYKLLQPMGCHLVVMGQEHVIEIFRLTKLDKLFHVVSDESALQDLLENAADIPIYVTRTQA